MAGSQRTLKYPADAKGVYMFSVETVMASILNYITIGIVLF